MGIYSKLIGGTLGFMIGGPFGAILGVAIGHTFDKKIDNMSQSGNRETGYISGQQAQITFFVATFSMLGKTASADGYVSPEERQAVDNFINNDLRLPPQEKEFAMRIFNAAVSSSEPFEKFAEQFYQYFKNEHQMLENMMDILVRLASADKNISQGEERLINTAASIFQYSLSDVNRLKIKYSTGQNYRSSYSSSTSSSSASLDVAYSILGCTSADTPETIKSKYKKLIKEFHPDVIASKGLPEEFTKFANEKFASIKSAYEDIKKARNF